LKPDIAVGDRLRASEWGRRAFRRGSRAWRVGLL